MQMTKHFTFNVLVENADGVYVAHCLETGLVATSEDASELPHKMVKMLVRQVEFALRNNNPADIFHPADPDVWERFFAARSMPESTQKKIHVENGGSIVLKQNAYAAATC